MDWEKSIAVEMETGETEVLGNNGEPVMEPQDEPEPDPDTVASVWGTVHEKTDDLKEMLGYSEQEWKHYWDACHPI